MRTLAPWLAAVAAIGFAACERPSTAEHADSARADSSASPDSIPDERPDSVSVAPPDSAIMTLTLLPPAPNGELSGVAADLGDRAVFVPRTQRWFMARLVDGTLAMDIGRIDGGVSNAEAFARMVAARSPVQPGMTVVLHPMRGATPAQVTGLRFSGRRLLATFDTAVVGAAMPAGGDVAVPVEWRGTPPAPVAGTAPPACATGDTAAISAAITRATPAPATSRTSEMTVLRGCFGDFRAIVTVRPLEITTESSERVLLVRSNGKVRSGRLRDLSYPLHALLAVTDVDADGTHEIIVHSVRPAMETWAALRMTDSVTFTRFASGFTIEKR